MPTKRVQTVSPEQLTAYASELLAKLEQTDFVPDAVIGIAEGGVHVVDAMCLPESTVVMSCRMRRDSTRRKERAFTRQVLQHLPRFAADLTRLLEDRARERFRGNVPQPTEALLEESSHIGAEVRRLKLRRLLLVDDAVDSGSTLLCVTTTLRESLPEWATLRTAAITVTRSADKTLTQPDVRLFDQTLLRFPWSLDYRVTETR